MAVVLTVWPVPEQDIAPGDVLVSSPVDALTVLSVAELAFLRSTYNAFGVPLLDPELERRFLNLIMGGQAHSAADLLAFLPPNAETVKAAFVTQATLARTTRLTVRFEPSVSGGRIRAISRPG
jgi:hypothetical protein